MSKQKEDHEKISEEYVEMSPATSVEMLEKMEKTGTFKFFLETVFNGRYCTVAINHWLHLAASPLGVQLKTASVLYVKLFF